MEHHCNVDERDCGAPHKRQQFQMKGSSRMTWIKHRNGASATFKKTEGIGWVELSNGVISWDNEEISCAQFIRKVLSECRVRWSLHKAFLDAWQGQIPTEVWLDVIREGIDMTCLLLDGLPDGHPFRIRMEAKAAELCAALQPHLEWMEKRMERVN
jgi:hypothetical protein